MIFVKSPINSRGFIFPFVLFFIFSGILVIAEITTYRSTNDNYDAFSLLQNQANINLENQLQIFKKILSQTNTNGSGTGAGADNDDYLLTGSGGTGSDDDVDAFAYRFGNLAPSETLSILVIDPIYLSYSTGFTLSTLGNISLTLDSAASLTLAKLDTAGRIILQKTLSGSVGANAIDPTGYTNGDVMALFLTNPSTLTSLTYTLSVNNTSGTLLGNLISAQNLGAGKYIYYSNILLPDVGGRYMMFSKKFSN